MVINTIINFEVLVQSWMCLVRKLVYVSSLYILHRLECFTCFEKRNRVHENFVGHLVQIEQQSIFCFKINRWLALHCRMWIGPITSFRTLNARFYIKCKFFTLKGGCSVSLLHRWMTLVSWKYFLLLKMLLFLYELQKKETSPLILQCNYVIQCKRGSHECTFITYERYMHQELIIIYASSNKKSKIAPKCKSEGKKNLSQDIFSESGFLSSWNPWVLSYADYILSKKLRIITPSLIYVNEFIRYHIKR